MRWSFFKDFLDSVDYKDNVNVYKVYKDEKNNIRHIAGITSDDELLIASGITENRDIVYSIEVDRNMCFMPSNMLLCCFVCVEKGFDDTRDYVLGRYRYYQFLDAYYDLQGLEGICSKSTQAPGRLASHGSNLLVHKVNCDINEIILSMGYYENKYFIPEFDNKCFYSDNEMRRVEYIFCQKNMYNTLKIAKDRIDDINYSWKQCLLV